MGWFRSNTSSTGDVERTPTFQERLAAIHPGVPGRCPSCDGLGYIDDLDLSHRYQIQHCKDCGHRWEYLFDTEGRVVGLTELDDEGRPMARMRVRPPGLLADTEPPRPAVPVRPPIADADVGGGPDAADVELDTSVIDLRSSAAEVLDLRDPASDADAEHMSPAEWLRHALRR